MSVLFDDATGEWLYNNSGTMPVTAEPLTMAIWANPDETGDGQTIMYLGQALDAAEGWNLQQRTTGNLAAESWSDGGSPFSRSEYTASSMTSGGGWYHCAGVWASATSRTAYLDGNAATEDTSSVTVDTPDEFEIGHFGGTSGYDPYSGQLMYPAVWNEALSAAEIASLAAGAHPFEIRPWALRFFSRLINTSDYMDHIAGLALSVQGTPVDDSEDPGLIEIIGPGWTPVHTMHRHVDAGSTAGGTGKTKSTSGTHRAYVSLSAAEAAEQADLTAAP